MDLDQASTKTFEPEWLKTKKHTPPLKYTRSKSSPLLPLTPGSQNAQQQQEVTSNEPHFTQLYYTSYHIIPIVKCLKLNSLQQQKDKNVFNMLKERNSWDRNFVSKFNIKKN
jgi:hypothetical protein